MHLFKLIALIVILKYVESVNILFISPSPSYSHSVVYFPIIRELSLRGHKVLSIMPDMLNDPTLVNLTEIDIHNKSYEVAKSEIEKLMELIKKNYRPIENIKWYNEFSYKCMDTFFQFPEVQKMINNPELYHFDLVITEWLTYQSSVMFAELFNCPLIGLSSYTIFLSGLDAIGSPTHPTYEPNSWDLYVDPNSFWERFKSVLFAIEYRYYYNYHFLPKQEYLVQKYFGNKVSTIDEVEKRVSLVLTNTNPVLHGAYPKAMNIIQFGGIHDPLFKSLPEDLRTFLDSAKNGFIYFSLGSNIKSFLLGGETISKITNAFKKLPYKIVWKFEADTLPGKPDNVYISKWVPQRAVLEHINIKLFITQGGLQSAEEAIRGRVPFLMIPFASDQYQNSGRFQRLGIGRTLLRTELTEESFEKTIHEVINNPRYKQRVIEVTETLWDQETKPLDRAIWWIEYVIRHKGAKYLRNPALDAPWYEAQLLDVYLLIISVSFLSILIIYISIRKLYVYIISKICHESPKIKTN